MSIRPIHREEFFRSLGAQRVQKGVINRELTGDDLAAAQTWLEGEQGRAAIVWSRRTVIATVLIGFVGAVAAYLAP